MRLQNCLILLFALSTCAVTAQEGTDHYDVILRGGDIYDGHGKPSYHADVGIHGAYIAKIGDLSSATADTTLNVTGLAVSPGFINTLSWAGEVLLVDGASQSNIRQGVTLEVLGEGRSMGPISPSMHKQMIRQQHEYHYDINWHTLGGYFDELMQRGIATNVASFVGASTIRTHVLGHQKQAPTDAQLQKMLALVDTAMLEGAVGVGAALIYAPGAYASIAELTALAQRAAKFGGGYSAHIRSESRNILSAIDETIDIAQGSQSFALIHHLKVAGQNNWHLQDQVINKINQARSDGLNIWANMYTYTAGSTGLDAAMPPWVQEGGLNQWIQNLQDPQTRAKVLLEMTAKHNTWENLLSAAGPHNTLLVGFRSKILQKYTGLTLAEVAQQRGTTSANTAIDLVIEDGSQVQVVYFLMSEANVANTLQQPWISFGSDARSISLPDMPQSQLNNTIELNSPALSNQEVNQKSNPEANLQTDPQSDSQVKTQPPADTHPRTYGNFARLLSKYVRQEQLISLTEAIRRLTSFPAENLNLKRRGLLAPGYFADIAIFDAKTIQDHATYTNPHQYSTGMVHVFVNGVRVLAEGRHTGARPGRIVRGPGWHATHVKPTVEVTYPATPD